MANINAFRAIRTHGYNFLPENKNSQLDELLEMGNYTVDEQPAIYIYEQETATGSQTGIWALTDVQDMEDGKIICHERTISNNEEKIRMQRENAGLEGSPVLLCYKPATGINRLIGAITTNYEPESFYQNHQYHRIWKVTIPEFIKQFREAFLKLDRVYIADGHHRMAAAAEQHKTEKQWISTLYVSTEQIRISAFHRLVIPTSPINEKLLFDTIGKWFAITASTNGKAILADQPHHIGLFYKGKRFKLSLKTDLYEMKNDPDVSILQEKVLKPLFDIQDPRNDQRLSSYGPDQGLPAMLYKLSKEPDAVAFTLYPMGIEQLITQAEKGNSLPPKSTWIEPKIPFGLLVYNARLK